METITIAGTEDTPTVNFNYDSGEFIISGRSLPEDVTTFYQPVLSWLDQFAAAPKNGAKFVFKLEYFNTASSKILLDVFMKLEEISDDSGSKFSIVWHFQNDDPDMKEAGEEYAELVTVPFEFVGY
jgi:SiaC family regulatory phosphoprotein